MLKCSHSELRASDSEDLCPLDSFSLPSEPPDIRNWYPSYEYESPELNTLAGFQDLDGSGETFVEDGKNTKSVGGRPVEKFDDALVDAPKNPSDVMKGKESDEFTRGKSSSPVTGSSDSLSFLSEPPDIKQWFSSYVYESPTLDTALDFAISDCKESQREDGKLCNVQLNCKQDKKDAGAEENIELCSQRRHPSVFTKCTNLVKDPKLDYQSVNKVTESSESLSFSSEPPDIKEWFPSYVYESPTLDTALDFAISDYKESEDGKLCNDQMNCRHDKKDVVAFVGAEENIELCSQRRDPNVFIKCTNSVKDPKLDYQSVSKDVHNAAKLTCDKVSDSSLSERRSNNHGEDDDGNLHFNSTDERSPSSLNVGKFIGSLDGESVWMSIGRIEAVKEKVKKKDLHGASDSTLPTGDSSHRSSHGKENDENELPENGFISIRKKSCQENAGNAIKRVRVEVIKRNQEKDAKIVRKVLSEISNFSSENSTGKWQCPQKNKPELGPPLKQLRLDQWFHQR